MRKTLKKWPATRVVRQSALTPPLAFSSRACAFEHHRCRRSSLSFSASLRHRHTGHVSGSRVSRRQLSLSVTKPAMSFTLCRFAKAPSKDLLSSRRWYSVCIACNIQQYCRQESMAQSGDWPLESIKRNMAEICPRRMASFPPPASIRLYHLATSASRPTTKHQSIFQYHCIQYPIPNTSNSSPCLRRESFPQPPLPATSLARLRCTP